MLCHSFCCILPVFGWVVGLNILGATLHAYESIFIVLNVMAMLGGYYYTYLHKIRKRCDHQHCQTVNKKIYWIATILSLILLIVPHFI